MSRNNNHNNDKSHPPTHQTINLAQLEQQWEELQAQLAWEEVQIEAAMRAEEVRMEEERREAEERQQIEQLRRDEAKKKQRAEEVRKQQEAVVVRGHNFQQSSPENPRAPTPNTLRRSEIPYVPPHRR